MKSRFLFPNYCRWIGLLLAIPGFILGYLAIYKDFYFTQFVVYEENLTNELALVFVVCGLMLVAFSKENREDELTARLRLDALYWAILINYAGYFIFEITLVVLERLNIYQYQPFFIAFDLHGDYCIYNIFTPLLIFILRFYYLLHYQKESFVVPSLKYLDYYPYRKIGERGTWICAVVIILLLLEVQFPVKIDKYMGLGYPLLMVFLILWVYSKNADEDELIIQFRLESMQLAVYINYLLLLVANFAFYFFDFLAVLTIGMVSIPLFFVIRFNYVSNRTYWQARNEMKGGVI